MTMRDAMATIEYRRANSEIMNDSTLGLWGKTKALTTLQNAAREPGKSGIQIGDMANGAIGAGLGWGVGAVMGKLFNTSPATTGNLKSFGMGLGTLLNSGAMTMDKHGQYEEARQAFRLGFMKAAMERGMLKESGANVLFDPTDLVTAPWRFGVNAGQTVASGAGALLGNLSGHDDTDVATTAMLVQQRELERVTEQMQARRRAAAVKKMLDRRIGR